MGINEKKRKNYKKQKEIEEIDENEIENFMK